MKNHLFHTVLFTAAIGLCNTATAGTISLSADVRDFKAKGTTGGHVDFENVVATDPGIVQTTLPANKRPAYAGGATGTPTTFGAAEFDMWYGGPTVAGIDPGLVIPISLTLAETAPGIFSYSSNSFFPIDGQGYGNQGLDHNYHFTLETHTEFTYQPGQTFAFTGDDDVWVYINNQLVIDLGGVHGAQSASVDLNTLGLTAGSTYDFDFYFAERHTTQSNLQITTSIPLIPTASVPEGGSTFGILLLSLLGLSAGKRVQKHRAGR